tara:strand:+ start:14917 stop:16083 length:1167 start_codon:yes stop_codon:yes gene_type:complete
VETRIITLGQKIKRYRLVNDIRQEDMAEKMGVSRATLINYEKGHTAINIDVLNRLKRHYPDFDLNDEKSKPKIIDNNTIDFSVLFMVLYRRKNYIITTLLLTMILGLGTSFLFTNYYSSEISLYPAKKDLTQGVSQFQSIIANLGVNAPKNDQNFHIPDVVKSKLIAKKIILNSWAMEDGKNSNLINLWSLNKKNWFGFKDSQPADSAYFIDIAIKKLNKHIDVNEDKSTGLIRIAATFKDPLISANIANYIVQEVQSYIQKENSAQSKKEKIFISDRLIIVKNELEEAEIKLKDFKERNRGYEDSPELFMVFSKFFREAEAKKEVYVMLQQQLELARIDEVKKSPILHILDKAVPPTRKSSPRRLFFMFLFSFIGFLYSSFRSIFIY